MKKGFGADFDSGFSEEEKTKALNRMMSCLSNTKRETLTLINDCPWKTEKELGVEYARRNPQIPSLIALETPRKRISELYDLGLLNKRKDEKGRTIVAIAYDKLLGRGEKSE